MCRISRVIVCVSAAMAQAAVVDWELPGGVPWHTASRFGGLPSRQHLRIDRLGHRPDGRRVFEKTWQNMVPTGLALDGSGNAVIVGQDTVMKVGRRHSILEKNRRGH
jgi:hypothetical protein